VISENRRVDAAVDALERRDLAELGRLLGASHASLRDDYVVSTPAVEAAVARLHGAGAIGARIIGGRLRRSRPRSDAAGSAGAARRARRDPGPGCASALEAPLSRCGPMQFERERRARGPSAPSATRRTVTGAVLATAAVADRSGCLL
jgi:hypothetical protein